MGTNQITYSLDDVSSLFNLDSQTVLPIAIKVLEQAKKNNDLLKDAVFNRDLNKIKMLAHDIKGSCGNLRYTKLSELALSIEEIAKGNETENSLYTDLCFQIDEYIDIYKRLLNS